MIAKPVWIPPVLGLIAVLSGANALWMLVAPESWYQHVPADVPDFGPYNVHFVRDLGCAFLTIASALFLALRRPEWRVPLVMVALAFFGLHAVIHVFDTARGHVDAHHWLLDLPTTYLPALLLAAVLRVEFASQASRR
jgi:hypothetical protein